MPAKLSDNETKRLAHFLRRQEGVIISEFDSEPTPVDETEAGRWADALEDRIDYDGPDHVEWNGWLYCEAEREAFEWETGRVECPHCGEELYVQEPSDD